MGTFFRNSISSFTTGFRMASLKCMGDG
jgi:hypothetical protein